MGLIEVARDGERRRDVLDEAARCRVQYGGRDRPGPVWAYRAGWGRGGLAFSNRNPPNQNEAAPDERPLLHRPRQVAKVDGIHRRATLEDGTEIDFGVHARSSPLRLDTEPDRPLPVDYIVAAAAG